MIALNENELFELLKSAFEKRETSNPRIKIFLNKLSNGTATFKDTAEYSEITSNLLGEILSKAVGDVTEPYVKENLCKRLLQERYKRINEILSKCQKSLDEKAGLKLNPQKAAYPFERVDQLAHSLEDPTVDSEVIKRRAGSAANVARSFHDDYIRENAQFRNDAGLTSYIVRTTDGNCCKWCSALAGRYVYGTEPHDVYRRHDNCGCTVIYENGRKRQDVWSKRTWEVKKPDKAYSPTVLNRQNAKALEKQNMNYLGIDNSVESGIMNINKSVSIPSNCKYLLQTDNNFSDKDISADILKVLNDTIEEQLRIKSDFKFDEIKIGKFNGDDKSVFITNYEVGVHQKTQLYLNEKYFIGDGISTKSIREECNKLYNDGWWKSKSLKDLVNHEIMHAKINYNSSYDKVESLYQSLREDSRVKGFCGLVDKCPDEFMNEMFVALNNGEYIEQKYIDVYLEYRKDYFGGG